jgi:MFS family permease
VSGNDSHSKALIADPEFRALGAVTILLAIARWLEFLAVGIFALDATGSAFLVALLALLRFFPLALFGVFLGALGDMADSRRLISIAIAAMAVISLALGGLFVAGGAQYWHVAGVTFLAGTFWAADMSLRRKLVGDIAGPDRLGAAMAFDNAVNNGARLVGPVIGGALYQWAGGTGVFLATGALYLAAFGFSMMLKRAPQTAAPDSWFMRPILNAWQAFRYAIGDREVLSILAVTIAFNIWGFPMFSMVPVIGKAELGLSASTVGVISAFQGGRPPGQARRLPGDLFLLRLRRHRLGAGYGAVSGGGDARPRRRGGGAGGQRLRLHAGDADLPYRAGRHARPAARAGDHLHRHRAHRVRQHRRHGGALRGVQRALDRRPRGRGSDGADRAFVARAA